MEPPSWRSPAGGVSPAPGVSPPPSSSSHAAKATTATAAIVASSHNHRYLRGRFIACLLCGFLSSTATICSYRYLNARSPRILRSDLRTTFRHIKLPAGAVPQFHHRAVCASHVSLEGVFMALLAAGRADHSPRLTQALQWQWSISKRQY